MTIALIPPSGPQSEAITVAAAAATLDYVPDPASIYITGYVRIYEGSPAAGQFKVTAGSAVLAFNAANNGASLTVGYNVATASGVTVDKVNEIIETVNESNPDIVIEAEGDLIVGDAEAEAARLPVGEAGQVLTVVDGVPAWAAPGTVNPMTTAGDMIYGGVDGAATRLAGGSEGNALRYFAGQPMWINTAIGPVIYMSQAKVAEAAGWDLAQVSALMALLPESITDKFFYIPIVGLQTGDRITAFFLDGLIESVGGNVSFTAKLVELDSATMAEADVQGMFVPLEVNADTVLDNNNTGVSLSTPQVVETGKTYALVVAGTTAASTTIKVAQAGVTVNRTLN